MSYPGPYAPPPAPAKRSNALPIIIAIVAVFGFCLVVGVGGFVGYRWIATPTTNVAEVPPKVVRSYRDGWKRYELGSVGMTADLPSKPERYTFEPDQLTNSLYAQIACYEVYGDEHAAQLYAYRQKLAGTYQPSEIVEGHSDHLPANASGLKQAFTKATIAGHPGAYGDFAYKVDGEPEHVRTAVVIIGAAEYTVVVYGYADTPAKAKRRATETLDRIVKSLELKPETAAMMK